MRGKHAEVAKGSGKNARAYVHEQIGVSAKGTKLGHNVSCELSRGRR